MFMLFKSQTSAIKYVFSFIPNQSNSDVGNMTSKSDDVYNTLLVLGSASVANNYLIILA